jgi:hypothetical protein
MTAQELARYVGKQADWAPYGVRGTCTVRITIKDARAMFGRIDLLVAPVAGTGITWIDKKFVSGLTDS